MAKKLRDFEYPLTDRVMKDEEDEKANEQGFDDIQQQSNRKNASSTQCIWRGYLTRHRGYQCDEVDLYLDQNIPIGTRSPFFCTLSGWPASKR